MDKGKKPLSETHPELAKEAFGWDPKAIVAGTNKKLKWQCSQEHIWESSGDNRLRGRGCPFCSNKKVLSGFNDLATTHPELAKEANGWDPKTVIAGTHKRLDWKCSQGHIWKVAGSNRVAGNNCPICSHREFFSGFNDLATTHPELAKEANGWDPKTEFAGMNKKVSWMCSKGHIWESSGSNRLRGRGCPFCSNKKVLSGFNDLATTHPELAKEANGWDPKTVIAGTSKKLEWKCQKGHQWTVTGNYRIQGFNCPICSNKKAETGFNDLATTHPELAKEAHGWDPKKIVAGSHKRVSWKCSEGHFWETGLESRVNANTSCPVCSNRKVQVGFNDLATTHPDLAKEAYGWDPKIVIASSSKKLEWKCSQGHLWKTTGEVRVKGNNCPICSNQKLLIGFNDLATTHPELAKEANGWDPKTVIAGTSKKLEWKCQKGHIWMATGSTRFVSGCPGCAKTGYNPNKSGYLYFLIQPTWEIFQIGITNFPDDRLKSHKRNGFEVLDLRGPMDGHSAQELEISLLRYLKNQKADLSPEHVAGKFDGYSESWTIDSFKVNNLKELIDKASEAGY